MGSSLPTPLFAPDGSRTRERHCRTTTQTTVPGRQGWKFCDPLTSVMRMTMTRAAGSWHSLAASQCLSCWESFCCRLTRCLAFGYNSASIKAGWIKKRKKGELMMNSSFTVALAQPSPVPLLHVSGEKCLLFSSNYLVGLTLGMPILRETAAAAPLCQPSDG